MNVGSYPPTPPKQQQQKSMLLHVCVHVCVCGSFYKL